MRPRQTHMRHRSQTHSTLHMWTPLPDLAQLVHDLLDLLLVHSSHAGFGIGKHLGLRWAVGVRQRASHATKRCNNKRTEL